MRLRDAIEKRADVKRFDLKAPNWRGIIRAVDAARFAPAAGNYFSARFILVNDEKVIRGLAESSQQSFIGKAKYCVVVVSDDSGLVRSYGERGEMYGRQHSGAAIENFLLALEEEKLMTSWVWYFDDDHVRRLLEVPDSVKIEGIFPIGKKTKVAGQVKRSAKLDNILYFGSYGNKKMKPVVKVGREVV